jgi:alkaline phosphatase
MKSRSANIYGLAGQGQDGLPYFTLSYANGPGYSDHRSTEGGRVNPNTLDRTPDNFRFPATVPLDSGLY